MQPIYYAWAGLIDITNLCGGDCAYCTRFRRHIRKDQFFSMTLNEIDRALESYHNWPSLVGIIGGEPLLHPQFEEVCRLCSKHFPRQKLHLFTSEKKKFIQYKLLISETFGHIAFNEHNDFQKTICLHQPNLISCADVCPTEEYKKKLIDECWVQSKWCPTISKKGAFFCEIAYGWDLILDGPGGWPVEYQWWKKNPEDFQDQVKKYCERCGMIIPMKRDIMSIEKEKISRGNYELFKQHNLPRIEEEDIEIIDGKFTIEEIESNRDAWLPNQYRQDVGMK